MALSPQLLQFKSSGVYRLEFDKSQTVNIPAETIRLIVGRSNKGPYNTPVLVEDAEQFKQVFGSIDKSLEKKGMFFHRSALEALSRGPILAMNLTAADDADRVSTLSPVTSSKVSGLTSSSFQSSEEDAKKFSDVFDTDKFWVPSDEKLLSATDEPDTHAISFVNIKQDPITVIVRQAADTRGFELTAREWYGEANIPEGIEADEYVSDYLVDVFVFKGSFDAAELNNDPNYGDFFEQDGLKKAKLAQFAGLREVTLLAQYNGVSLIPEFIDNEGNQMYIETIVNLEARRTGLFCAVQEDALDKIDLVGEGFDIYQDYEVLSHRVNQERTQEVAALPAGAFASAEGTTLTLFGAQSYIQSDIDALILAGLRPGKYLAGRIEGEYVKIETITLDNGSIVITCDGNVSKVDHETFAADAAILWEDGIHAPFSVVLELDNQDQPTGNLIIENGANYPVLTAGQFENHFLKSDIEGEYRRISSFTAINGTNNFLISGDGGGFDTDYVAAEQTAFVTYSKAITPIADVWTLTPNARVEQFPLIGTGWNFTATGAGRFTYSAQEGTAGWNSAIKVGMYVPADGGKLARILKIAHRVENGQEYYDFTAHRVVSSDPTYALKRYEDTTGFYKTFPLAGATQTEKSIAELLAAVKPGTGLGNALVDKDNITFRYVVDTFGSLENGTLLNKEELSFLCAERQNASAILNAPMVKEFKASTNPSFLNTDGSFNVNHVATGGNLDLNPTGLYTLPSINEGANYAFYYGPGLNVIENGRTKVVPPAAYVSNNYIDKYLNDLPWSIVAGPRRGVVGGTGVQSLEFAFDKNDRDVLEPFGYNPIVFERGVGLTIKGNKTAQQGVKSALSSAHVREALIYIEDGLAEILKNYLFEFNNAQTRLEIKTLADNFMESVKKDGGVYDYKNVMDASNNTSEVIDNNMGILDTFVEPVKGLEILVSRVTVLNTGDIASGNFA